MPYTNIRNLFKSNLDLNELSLFKIFGVLKNMENFKSIFLQYD